MIQIQVNIDGAAALRDFFLARNGSELERTYGAMTKIFPNKAPLVDNWNDVEFIFNRLFVGPSALEAPPFASIYLDTEPLVMGKTTIQVRKMYASIGLESPWKNQLPDDHISLELDAALAMNHVAQESFSNEIAEIRSRFVAHMDAWVSQFVDSIYNAPSSHPAISFAAGCLSYWMKRQHELL